MGVPRTHTCVFPAHTHVPRTHTCVFPAHTHVCSPHTHMCVPRTHTHVCSPHTHTCVLPAHTHMCVPRTHTHVCSPHTHMCVPAPTDKNLPPPMIYHRNFNDKQIEKGLGFRVCGRRFGFCPVDTDIASHRQEYDPPHCVPSKSQRQTQSERV